MTGGQDWLSQTAGSHARQRLATIGKQLFNSNINNKRFIHKNNYKITLTLRKWCFKLHSHQREIITVNAPEVKATYRKEISSQFMQGEKKNTNPALLQTFKPKADCTEQWLKDRLTIYRCTKCENQFLAASNINCSLKKKGHLTLAASDM